MTIRAEVHTDDYHAEADFNAAPWFEQASTEQILALAACDWGGDYPADAVAEWFVDFKRNARVVDLFAYLRAHNRVARRDNETMGFECHVNESDALRWLRKHRPAIAAQLATSPPAVKHGPQSR